MGPSGRKARGCSRHGRPYHIDWSTKNRLKIYFSGCFSYCLNGSPVDRIELLHKACNFRLYSSLLSKKRAELANYSSGFFSVKNFTRVEEGCSIRLKAKIFSTWYGIRPPRRQKQPPRKGTFPGKVTLHRLTRSPSSSLSPRTTAPLPSE